MTIDDSALNGAAWELEAHTAQAPSLPRAAGVTVLPHLGCAHSFQVHLENGNAERDAADDTPGLSARLRLNTGMAEVVQSQESRRILEGSPSIPKKLPGFKDVILMSASNRHYNFQRVQKFKFLFLTDCFIEHHKRTISVFCGPPFIGSLEAF